MGTSNRSKAFHDVAWKNIKDAGFPDRILWHKAVAAKYPSYDISRVGIYGTSAGGQSALGALLFHPEFYKAAVSAAGCHDNRMDKIWWNEQWMGWPIGPEYAASSNVDNAYRLQGKVLLVVGEMDTNVDPSSTMQVVNALVKANKTFDLLVIPGAGHGSGGAYGDRKRYDFFVQHLLGQTPPAWNAIKPKAETPRRVDGRTRAAEGARDAPRAAVPLRGTRSHLPPDRSLRAAHHGHSHPRASADAVPGRPAQRRDAGRAALRAVEAEGARVAEIARR